MPYDQPLPLYWVGPGRGVPPYVYIATISNPTFPNVASTFDFTKPPNVKAAIRGFNSTGTPYVMQYNLNIQSQVFRDTAVTFGYLGSQSRKLIISAARNLNQ